LLGVQKKGILQERIGFNKATKSAEKNQKSIDTVKKTLDASQRIRINASNLILRSEPRKASNPLLTADKKKAIMLQPGEIVTPELDGNGDIRTISDGPRKYIKVTLSDRNTQGWIALSDKLRGGYKQEYGDINLEAGVVDSTVSYKLK